MYAPYAERSRYQIAFADERRAALRHKSFSDVWADPGGMQPALPCKVIDLSTTGAKIDSPYGTLPDRFVLTVGNARHVAQVVWRRQTLLGVEFQKGVKPPREGTEL